MLTAAIHTSCHLNRHLVLCRGNASGLHSEGPEYGCELGARQPLASQLWVSRTDICPLLGGLSSAATSWGGYSREEAPVGSSVRGQWWEAVSVRLSPLLVRVLRGNAWRRCEWIYFFLNIPKKTSPHPLGCPTLIRGPWPGPLSHIPGGSPLQAPSGEGAQVKMEPRTRAASELQSKLIYCLHLTVSAGSVLSPKGVTSSSHKSRGSPVYNKTAFQKQAWEARGWIRARFR